MNLASIKSAVSMGASRQLLHAKKNSPTVFFAVGVVGSVASTVIACRATLKLDEVLERAEKDRVDAQTLVHKDYSEEDLAKDLMKIKFRTVGEVVKLYAPAVIVGGLSIAALTGSYRELNRRNTAAMAAYAALDRGFKEYRERVREELGDEKDLHFRHGVENRVETVMDDNDEPKQVKHAVVPEGMPSIYARWFDDSSTQWQKAPGYNQQFVLGQQRYLNDLLVSRGHVFLNEVYDALGLQRTQEGTIVGWVRGLDEKDGYIDFGLGNEDDDRIMAFMRHNERNVLLDFNVDGVIWDLI